MCEWLRPSGDGLIVVAPATRYVPLGADLHQFASSVDRSGSLQFPGEGRECVRYRRQIRKDLQNNVRVVGKLCSGMKRLVNMESQFRLCSAA